jgi:uncharacterized membrane protein YhaH (DUF805 family)
MRESSQSITIKELYMSNNPYQTPAGQLETDDDQAFGEVSFFDPAGRINRLRYWAHTMVLLFGTLLVGGIIAGIMSFVSSSLGMGILGITYVVMIVFSFIVTIQRLHDMNYSGWLSILLLIPLASFILWIMLIAIPSTPGRNRFGLQPPPNKTWHWIAGLVMPIVTVVATVGLLAAIAIPQYQRYVEKSKAAQEQSYEYEQTAEDSYYTDDAQTESETTGEEEYDSEPETVDGTEETTEESVEETTDENSVQ